MSPFIAFILRFILGTEGHVDVEDCVAVTFHMENSISETLIADLKKKKLN